MVVEDGTVAVGATRPMTTLASLGSTQPAPAEGSAAAAATHESGAASSWAWEAARDAKTASWAGAVSAGVGGPAVVRARGSPLAAPYCVRTRNTA